MIIDKELEYGLLQAITATAASTNKVDMGHTQNWGAGKRLRVRFLVGQAFNTLTSLTVALRTDSTAAMSSAVVLGSFSAVLAALTAGAEFTIDVPITNVEQFTDVLYTVVGTDPTEGTITAFTEVYDAPEGDSSVIPGNL